jgi:hypothetical protein
MPQSPQLSGSVWVDRQVPPQQVWSGAQVVPQASHNRWQRLAPSGGQVVNVHRESDGQSAWFVHRRPTPAQPPVLPEQNE